LSQTAEEIQNKRELNSLTGKPQHIQIDALKTKQAYDDAYKAKGIVATSKRDYPRSGQGYRQIQRLLQFDHLINISKGKIRTVVNTMTVQPVTVEGKKKYALYYQGQYIALDSWGSEISHTFTTGYHYAPELQFGVTDVANPFDPKTGERKGSWKAVGFTYEHDIFIPEEPKERRKFLQNLTKDMDVSNCVFSYRQASPTNNHQSNHGQISFNNLCDLTFEQEQESH
jgi:hypothetical protein